MTHCSSVVRQLIVELDQRTVCRQNSRHHHHLNRNTQADHHTSARTGERQQKTIVGVTLPGGTSSRCTVLVVVYVAWQELMSGNRLCIPGTDRPVNRFSGNGVDSLAENQLFQPRVGCISRNRAPGCGASERKLRV